MPNLTIHEDPAATEAPQHNAPKADESVITDRIGRKLKIAEPSILAEARLVRAMGDGANNQAFMVGYVLPACMVTSIDGTDLDFPMTEAQVDAAIKIVGREGIAAVMAHVVSSSKESRGEDAGDIKK